MIYENEITVEISCNEKELLNILKTNNFKMKEQYDLIDYYLIKDYDSNIDQMKNEIKKYNIPIKDNNYFVKKAVIELKEIYN